MDKDDNINLDQYDKVLLEKFLTLIRDKYKIVDKANFFLEINGISSVNIGITNQRDAISHFITFLKLTNHSDSHEQLFAAEEHLRRAILEPYQVALDIIQSKIYESYDYLLTIGYEDTAHMQQVLSRMEEINGHYIEGRKQKGGNKWDENLDKGIDSFIEGFQKAKKLSDELTIQVAQLRKIPSTKAKDNTRTKVVIGLIIFLLGLAIGVLV